MQTSLVRFIKILGYKQLKTFFLTKIKILGLLIYWYFFLLEKNNNIIYFIFFSFVFKLLLLMRFNFDFFSLMKAYYFIYYQNIYY